MVDHVSRTDRKRQEARTRILAAAEQLFIVEASYDQATIREIARRADVSVGAVYLHFKTKADILAALLDSQGEHLRHLIEETTAPPTTGFAKLSALMSLFESMRKDKYFVLYARLSVLSVSGAVSKAILARHIGHYKGTLSLLADIIREGIEDGTIRPGIEPELRAMILMNIMMSFTKVLIIDEVPSFKGDIIAYEDDAFFSAFAQFLLDAFRSTPENPPGALGST